MIPRFLLVPVVGLFGINLSLAQTTQGWETLAPEAPPAVRHECAFAELGGKFYLIGGRGLKPVEEYNPATNRWRALTPPPIEMHHFQAVSYQGRIYVLGALTGAYPAETPVPHVYSFDPAKDSWEKGPDIPASRRRGAAGVVSHNGKIYLVCGIQDGHRGDFVPWLDEWNPKTNVWKVLPDAPRPRDHFQAALVKNRIVAVGGRTTSQRTRQVFELTIPEVDVYDLAAARWETLSAKLPTPRGGCAVLPYRDKVMVIGGESGSSADAHKEVEVLDVAAGKWESMPMLGQGRHGTQAIHYRSAVFIAAGCGKRGGNPELNSIEKLVLGR